MDHRRDVVGGVVVVVVVVLVVVFVVGQAAPAAQEAQLRNCIFLVGAAWRGG